MSADGDLIKLYSARILALASNMPMTERLVRPDVTVNKRSPLCGSTITIDLEQSDGVITGFAQEVRACALGQAAASVVGATVIGRSRAEVEAAREQLKAMLTEGAPAPLPPFQELEALLPARDYKNRHASIMLSLDALVEAFGQIVNHAHA